MQKVDRHTVDVSFIDRMLAGLGNEGRISLCEWDLECWMGDNDILRPYAHLQCSVQMQIFYK
jgi:hypothetical protein